MSETITCDRCDGTTWIVRYLTQDTFDTSEDATVNSVCAAEGAQITDVRCAGCDRPIRVSKLRNRILEAHRYWCTE